MAQATFVQEIIHGEVMTNYGDHHRQQTSLSSVAIGIAYALTIVAMLQLCISLYPSAEASTFHFVTLFAGSLSFILFSSARYQTIRDGAYFVHSFGTIVRLWAWVFLALVVTNFMTKSGSQFSRVVMMTWFLSTPFALLITSLVCRLVLLRIYNLKQATRTAIFIGFSEDAQHLAQSISTSKLMGIKCLGYFDNRHTPRIELTTLTNLGTLAEAVAWVQTTPVDIVFISLSNTRSSELTPIVEMLQDTVSSIYFVPESRLFGMTQIQQADIAGVPVLVAYETPFLGVARVSKRLFDVVLSSVILLLLSPVMAGLAIGVKLSSPGPVLFRQKRYGIGGVEIDVLKFRSMRIYAPDSAAEVKQATATDARITPFGRFIRRTSLDELPQFVNVLKGSMSIVGPRPHATQHNELYRKQIRGYMLRHKVKPGITGWAQVNGFRGETETLDKMQKRIEYDLYYIRNWSLKQDFVIVLRTIALVFRDRNAY